MDDYPVRFAVEYPDRPLNRLTTALRIFTAIPIAIVLLALGQGYAEWGGRQETWVSMSVAKSFVSAAIGIAVADGLIRAPVTVRA